MENRTSYPAILDRLMHQAFVDGNLTVRQVPGAFELAVYKNGIVTVLARTRQISSGDQLNQYERALVSAFNEARDEQTKIVVENVVPQPSDRVTEAQARRAAFKVVS